MAVERVVNVISYYKVLTNNRRMFEDKLFYFCKLKIYQSHLSKLSSICLKHRIHVIIIVYI